MVNGPASGGEFPLGKEYWENQANKKGYEYDPSKNASTETSKETLKIPVGQTQKGEAAHIVQKFSAKDIANLIKKYKINQKKLNAILSKNGESIKLKEKSKNSLERIELPQHEVNKALEEIIKNIPEEDMVNLQSKADIIKYIKEHPELKQNISLDGKKEETTELANKEEKQSAEKTNSPRPDVTKQVEEDGQVHYYKKDPQYGEEGYEEISKEEYDNIMFKQQEEDKPQITEKLPEPDIINKKPYVKPETNAKSDYEAMPIITPSTRRFGSKDDVPDYEKTMD